MSSTKYLLSRTKNHTIMPNCGAPGCTNRSTTNPEKRFRRLPSVSKKRMRDSWMAKINDLKVRFDFSEKNYFGHFN